jgi:hypothetical protein
MKTCEEIVTLLIFGELSVCSVPQDELRSFASRQRLLITGWVWIIT